MGNIVDYVRGCSKAFSEEPLNRVDSLVFSWLAYLRIPEEVPAAAGVDGATLGEIAIEANMVGLTAPLHDPGASENLLLACAVSPRYRDVRACLAVDDWSHRQEKQFGAITFALPGGGAVAAFRGTDNTLVGWKECLNMAFSEAVPAQEAAVEYVQHVAAQLEGPLWLAGHSKGGNLAEYAALNCDVATCARIERVFAHDAPGFSDQALAAMERSGSRNDAGSAPAIAIERTVPEESLVGMLLFGRTGEPAVVRSTNPGILQHSPFSWVVQGCDFALASAVTYDAYRRGKRLNAWVSTLSPASRERVVDILYSLVQATGEVTLSGLGRSLQDGSLQLMLQRFDGIAAADREFFLDAMADLAATMLLGPAPANPQTPADRTAQAADRIDDITAKFNDRLSRWEQYLEM